MLDEQTAHAERNAVALVGGDAAFPEWFWNHAEHRPAVEFLSAGLEGVDFEAADLAGLE